MSGRNRCVADRKSQRRSERMPADRPSECHNHRCRSQSKWPGRDAATVGRCSAPARRSAMIVLRVRMRGRLGKPRADAGAALPGERPWWESVCALSAHDRLLRQRPAKWTGRVAPAIFGFWPPIRMRPVRAGSQWSEGNTTVKNPLAGEGWDGSRILVEPYLVTISDVKAHNGRDGADPG